MARIDENCPTDDSRYKLMMNQCYFFDSGKRNYSAAQDYCKTAFGDGTLGKLFEPINMHTFNLTKDAATSVLGTSKTPWIGFEKVENTWKHASNNLISAQIHPWNANFDSNSEKYLIFKTVSSNTWDTEGPTNNDKNPSICQLVTVTESLLTNTAQTIDEKFETQINEVKTNATNILARIDENCPTDDSRYKLMMNQCYFFDSGKRNYSAAQDYCKTAFGDGTLGKLFER